MKIIKFLIIFFFISFKVNANTLNDIINIAISNNKEINIINSDIKIKKIELSRTYLLDNPMIEFEVMNLPLAPLIYGEEMMNTLQASIYQKIPLPKKLDIKRNISNLELNKENYILEEKINELKKDLKINYYSYYFYNEAIKIINDNRELLESLLKILNIKYSTSKISLKDILSLQLEIISLKEKILNYSKEKERIIYNINTLIGKENYLSEINYKNIKIRIKEIEINNLIKVFIENRYNFKLIKNYIFIEEKNKDIAELSYIPDLGLKLSYGIRKNRADILSTGLSVDIPLWFNEKEKTVINEIEEKINKLNFEYENLKFNTINEIKKLLSEITELRELYNIYQNLMIPNLKEIGKNLISEYELGKIDFSLVIENQKKMFDYKLKLLEIVSEHEKKISYLEYIIGKDIL